MQVKVERVILVGAGAFARELINWYGDATAHTAGCAELVGFLDASSAAMEAFDYGLSYFGQIESYVPMPGDGFLMAIGDPVAKKRIAELLLTKGATFVTLIHPTAVVARTAKIGVGVVICPQAVISGDSTLGCFSAVNALSGIGHDVVVGAYTTLSAHVDLTGWVRVGEACFFGTGARVLPRVEIGREARVGAGAVVMRKVPDYAVMFTPPAKKLS